MSGVCTMIKSMNHNGIKWCMCDEVGRVARDMHSTCKQCGGLWLSLWLSLWLKRMSKLVDAGQYYYLSVEDSLLYDNALGSTDPKDGIILGLLLSKAQASYRDHCNQLR